MAETGLEREIPAGLRRFPERFGNSRFLWKPGGLRPFRIPARH